MERDARQLPVGADVDPGAELLTHDAVGLRGDQALEGIPVGQAALVRGDEHVDELVATRQAAGVRRQDPALAPLHGSTAFRPRERRYSSSPGRW